MIYVNFSIAPLIITLWLTHCLIFQHRRVSYVSNVNDDSKRTHSLYVLFFIIINIKEHNDSQNTIYHLTIILKPYYNSF